MGGQGEQCPEHATAARASRCTTRFAWWKGPDDDPLSTLSEAISLGYQLTTGPALPSAQGAITSSSRKRWCGGPTVRGARILRAPGQASRPVGGREKASTRNHAAAPICQGQGRYAPPAASGCRLIVLAHQEGVGSRAAACRGSQPGHCDADHDSEGGADGKRGVDQPGSHPRLGGEPPASPTRESMKPATPIKLDAPGARATG